MSLSKKIFPFAFSLLFAVTACYRPEKKLEPTVFCPIHPRQLGKLNSAFSKLSSEELQTQWGSEYLVGTHFAKELDFYRAITSFKRAHILAEQTSSLRKMQIEYSILLAYFLAGKYSDVTYYFESSYLRSHITQEFPAFHDLLIMLHESYLKCNREDEADEALKLLEKENKPLATKVALFDALSVGHFEAMDTYAAPLGYAKDLHSFKKSYHGQEKSMQKAATLSMFFPGAGYLYVGQKRAAVTSFLINTLFITAAATFYSHGHIAAGIITTGFEMGWYFGGIYGSAQAAKQYNEALYNGQARFLSEQHRLGPQLQLRFAF